MIGGRRRFLGGFFRERAFLAEARFRSGDIFRLASFQLGVRWHCSIFQRKLKGITVDNPDQSFDLSVKNHDQTSFSDFKMKEGGDEKIEDAEGWTRGLLTDKLPRRGVEIWGYRSWATPLNYPP